MKKMSSNTLEVGKLYKYISHGEKVIYSSDPTGFVKPENADEYHYNSSHFNMIIGDMLQNDMFVPLENVNNSGIAEIFKLKVVKILTTTGIIGWVYMRDNDATLA